MADVGWTLRTQKAFETLCSSFADPGSFEFFYLGLTADRVPGEKLRAPVHAFVVQEEVAGTRPGRTFFSMVNLIEQGVTAADHGRVIGFRESAAGTIEPELDGVDPVQASRIRSTQEEILRGVRAFADRFVENEPGLPDEELRGRMLRTFSRWVEDPGAEVARWFSRLEVGDDQNESFKTPMVQRLDLSDLAPDPVIRLLSGLGPGWIRPKRRMLDWWQAEVLVSPPLVSFLVRLRKRLGRVLPDRPAPPRGVPAGAPAGGSTPSAPLRSLRATLLRLGRHLARAVATMRGTITLRPLYPATAPAGGRRIPGNVFRTYRTRTLDADHARSCLGLVEANPGFTHHFFDDLDMDEYMAEHWRSRRIYAIYKNTVHGAARADIWRYCILWDHGGAYLDIDSSLRLPLDRLPPDASEVLAYEANDLARSISAEYTPDPTFFSRNAGALAGKLDRPERTILQWFLILEKHHPILASTIARIEENERFFADRVFASIRHAIVNFTGPIVFSRAVWEHVLAGNAVTQRGTDFDGIARFEDVPVLGLYNMDEGHYHRDSFRKVLDTTAVRLHLGCSDVLLPAFVNIDAASGRPGVVPADLDRLEEAHPAGSVHEIVVRDALAGVEFETASRRLRSWAALLGSGGVMTITAPCVDALPGVHGGSLTRQQWLGLVDEAGLDATCVRVDARGRPGPGGRAPGITVRAVKRRAGQGR